jgi:hypothetical protein
MCPANLGAFDMVNVQQHIIAQHAGAGSDELLAGVGTGPWMAPRQVPLRAALQ